MNKHLKPCVAVDVRGASDEDVQAVIEACLALGAVRFEDCRIFYFVKWSICGYLWLSDNAGDDYAILTINQALGRESEVENAWFERGELPPVGAKVEFVGHDQCNGVENIAKGQAVEIVVHFKAQSCMVAGFLFKGSHGEVFISQAKHGYFRPLKTEKEKFVERAKKEFPDFYDEFYFKMYELVRFIDGEKDV